MGTGNAYFTIKQKKLVLKTEPFGQVFKWSDLSLYLDSVAKYKSPIYNAKLMLKWYEPIVIFVKYYLGDSLNFRFKGTKSTTVRTMLRVELFHTHLKHNHYKTI